MSKIKLFKKWFLNRMAPYIEGVKKKEGISPINNFSPDNYSDLNEDTEYL